MWTPWPICEVLQPRTGGKDLKSSGAYPVDFGRKVALLHVSDMAA